MEHGVNHLATNLLTTTLLLTTNLLATNLLAEIHRLVDQPLILEPRLDLALLKPCSLMVLLWKHKLPRPSIIDIHRHRPCR